MRTTKSYASVPPFGTPIEELANGPALDSAKQMREQYELQMRAHGTIAQWVDGQYVGQVTWRGELGKWDVLGRGWAKTYVRAELKAKELSSGKAKR